MERLLSWLKAHPLSFFLPLYVHRGAGIMDRYCPDWATRFDSHLRDEHDRPLIKSTHDLVWSETVADDAFRRHQKNTGKPLLRYTFGFVATNPREYHTLFQLWQRQIALRTSHDF